jgi:hypothetical protein
MRHLRIFESHTEQLQEATPPKTESKESIQNKRMANFFNKLYKMNLPLDGNGKNPEYIKAFTRYCGEKKITTHICKKGDGFCSDLQAGEITVKDAQMRAKFERSVKNNALALLMKP